jgi:RimJ/RimL family protein N-acetyltransferase
MNPIAETDRLILRKLDISDALDFYNLNADPEVLKYTGDVPFQTIAEAEGFLENYQEYQKNGFGRWAVISRASNAFLGWCGLKLNDDRLVDLGFRFFLKEWGKGYATESARAVLNFGFSHLAIDLIIGGAAVA